jgi:hypothetical protein
MPAATAMIMSNGSASPGWPRCLGWLVEPNAGSGSCSLGVACDALTLLDNYSAYRAAHTRLRAEWLDEAYDER